MQDKPPSFVPAGTVEDVLITQELSRRPWRGPDCLLENQALGELATALAEYPGRALQKLADLTQHLCRAGSAGISILESEGGKPVFRWHALTGELAPHAGETLSFDDSPCGAVVKRKELLLFQEPGRFFAPLRSMRSPIREALLAPWKAEGREVGALWAVAHHPERHFDSEDARLLANLSRFAAAAHAIQERGRSTEELRAERTAALNLMEDAISARQKADEAEECWRALASGTAYAIYRMSPDWSEMRQLMGQGFLADTPVADPNWFQRYLYPEDKAIIMAAIRQAVSQKSLFELEHRVRRADGSPGWTLSRAVPLLDERGGIREWFGSAADITGQREATNRLSAALREAELAKLGAEAANKAKDHFLAVLSHELRTPLTPVLMAVHALARRRDLPEEVQEALEMIRRNIRTEARLIDDLLDITRITRGKMELNQVPMDLHQAIRDAVEVSKPDLESKEQPLVLRLDAPTSTVFGDAERLQQVLWNLLKNASKFSPPRSEIHLSTRHQDGAIILEVADKGIGIEPEALHRIFDAFAQANSTITREFGGLGLGLAISKATVEAHHGTITAQSEGPNRGAIFTVCLPLYPEGHQGKA